MVERNPSGSILEQMEELFQLLQKKIRDLKKIKQNWSVYVQMYIDYLRKSIHYAPSVSRSGFIFNHQ